MNFAILLGWYVISPSTIFLDSVSIPKLSIGLENGKVVVSWPIEFIGYSLEWTDDLGDGKLITVPANEINISEEKHSYIHQPVEKARFYRLIKR